ncbi:MAG: type II secretion system protein [Lachnobacterium sp.]|nr:type II secretion system protein [Lachnobacterium sp.]MDY5461721.1 type II secretion system protein [Agathobacter sp.]
MKKQQNQRALSNAGFSLLEVILSMAILAILSIPLMSYFTQSMKYNAKMADKQHASNLAQEVMENLKNQPNLVQNVDASGFDVPYLAAENYVKASYTPAAPGPTETGGSVDYYGQADAIGEKYDIRVSVSTNQAENLSKVPQVDGIDGTVDVIALENGQLQNALIYFSSKNRGYADEHNILAMSRDAICAKLRRTISITVKADYVTVECFYRCDGVPGVDADDQYQCSNYAEEDIENVQHIYLMYEVHQNTDEIELRCDVGVRVPKLVIVCQNIDKVNTDFPLYRLTISPKNDCSMPEIASNLGQKSYENPAETNKGKIWKDSYLLSNVKALVEKEQGIRKVNIEVSVYKKDKGDGTDKDDYRYITVDSAKGE